MYSRDARFSDQQVARLTRRAKFMCFDVVKFNKLYPIYIYMGLTNYILAMREIWNKIASTSHAMFY